MIKKLQMTNSSIEVYVDDEDYEWAKFYNWSLNNYGYAQTRENGKTKFLHKMIAERMGIIGNVDHKDRFPWNCLQENLRSATHSQNGANSSKHNGTSQYKGVCWNKRDKKWKARIRVNYDHIYLGCFELEEDAAKAYDIAALKYFGEFASLNFPE